ncbi:hypothetical protein Zmor_014099 [Zophobas morio]|uniref:Uncharacterized protein n=1 Tax=Zophobas morio TaxID=2755281 RepID=A0AA38IH61_9CUCU|nr:hypothetical protein Zmor_014099 [Zophobas morio]
MATPFQNIILRFLCCLGRGIDHGGPSNFGEFNDTARVILVHVPNPAIAAALTLVLNAVRVQPPLARILVHSLSSAARFNGFVLSLEKRLVINFINAIVCLHILISRWVNELLQELSIKRWFPNLLLKH